VGGAGGEGGDGGDVDAVRQPRQLPDRWQRSRVFLRVLQPQAPGGRAVLPDDVQGQGGQAIRRERHVSPTRPQPNAPVKQYWSATIYDRATHALIRNLPWSSRSSQTPGLQANADGSVDVYFGPKAPGGNESNWVPTSASGKFEVLFRFYGPEKALFEKTWKLPDIEEVKG
jgi:hypothetical protein